VILVAHMCFGASKGQGVGVAIMDHDLETVVDTGIQVDIHYYALVYPVPMR